MLTYAVGLEVLILVWVLIHVYIHILYDVWLPRLICIFVVHIQKKKNQQQIFVQGVQW